MGPIPTFSSGKCIRILESKVLNFLLDCQFFTRAAHCHLLYGNRHSTGHTQISIVRPSLDIVCTIHGYWSPTLGYCSSDLWILFVQSLDIGRPPLDTVRPPLDTRNVPDVVEIYQIWQHPWKTSM